MKYCEEYAALLDAFADGECTGEEAAKVREHLAVCPGCQSYLNEILLIKDAFPDEDVEIPEGLSDGILAAVRADAAPRKRTAKQWAKIWLPRVACFALAVGIGIFWMAIGGAGRSSNSGAVATAAVDTASSAETDAAENSGEGGVPQTILKSSGAEECAPAGSQEALDSQPSVTAGAEAAGSSSIASGAEEGFALGAAAPKDQFAEAGAYARWAAFTASEVGDALNRYDGQSKTDPLSGEIYTLYELSASDFDRVIAALDASDAVTVDDSSDSSLCAVAVYPD